MQNNFGLSSKCTFSISRKSDNYGYCDNWKSDSLRKCNKEKKQRRSWAITVYYQCTSCITIREKANIAIVILEKLIKAP